MSEFDRGVEMPMGAWDDSDWGDDVYNLAHTPITKMTDQQVIQTVQNQIKFANDFSDGDAKLTEIQIGLLQRLINMAVPTIELN